MTDEQEKITVALVAALIYAGDSGPAYREGVGVDMNHCIAKARRLFSSVESGREYVEPESQPA